MSINSGLGTLLKHGNGDGPPETFTTIAQRVSIDGPEMSVGTADTTHLDSTAKTHRITIPDNGELELTIYYDPKDTTHQFCTGLMITPTQKNWQLVFSEGSIYQFNGTLTKWKPTGMEVESNLEAEATIKVNGVVTITP